MIFLEILKPLGNDFRVYFEAVQMIFSGQNPYQGIISSTFPYNYPPTSFLFTFWLVLFPYATSSVIWNLFSTFSILFSIFLILKTLKVKSSIAYIVCFFLFTLPFFPVKFNIGNGQINNFLLLITSFSIYAFFAGKQNISALSLAYAAGIKLAPGVLIFFYFLKKEYVLIVKFLVFLFLLYSLTLTFVPQSMHLDYWQKVFPLSFSLGAKDWYYNQSVWGFMARTFNNQGLIYISSIFASLVILLLTLIKGRKMEDFLKVSAVTCLYLLIHPVALQHYFGFSIIPFLILGVDTLRKNHGKASWLILVTAYFLIAFDIKNFSSVSKSFNFVLSHDFYGVFLLWAISLWPKHASKVFVFSFSMLVLLVYLLNLTCKGGLCF